MIYVKDESQNSPLISVTKEDLKEYVQRYYYRNDPQGEKSINIEFNNDMNTLGSVPLLICTGFNMYCIAANLSQNQIYHNQILGLSTITSAAVLNNNSTGGRRIKIELNDELSAPPQVLSLRRGVVISNIWLL